jgi:hypothetical protein
MIDEKIARVKALIQKREEIDAELATLFGGGETPRRGRPRKEPAGHADNTAVSTTLSTAPDGL